MPIQADDKPSFGALALLRSLRDAGSTICFANPGTTEMWAVAALDAMGGPGAGGIRGVLGLHENVCTGAADGFARMLPEQLPLVLLHLGPGLGNGLANLHNAHRARSPMVVLVGQMSSWHIEADPFLSMDIAGLAATVSCLTLQPRTCCPLLAPAAGLAAARAATAAAVGSPGHALAPLPAGLHGNSPAEMALQHLNPATLLKAPPVGLPSSMPSQRGGADGQPAVKGVSWRESQQLVEAGVRGLAYQVVAAQDDMEQAVQWADAKGGVSPLKRKASGGVPGGAGAAWGAAAGSQPADWHVTPGVMDSRVVTLIVPHDLTWEGAPPSPDDEADESDYPPVQRLAALAGGEGASVGAKGSAGPWHVPRPGCTGVAQLPGGVVQFVRDCAAALRQCPRGKAALYLAGEAMLDEGGGLHAAGVVAAAVGATLLCNTFFARMDRGHGRPHAQRVPYFPEPATELLSKYDMLVMVDARLPVAGFGYKDGPSQLVPARLVERDAVWELDIPPELKPGGVAAALQLLAQELTQGGPIIPGVNCGGVFPVAGRPPLPPPGVKLTAPTLCCVVAALQPEGAIIVDESLTSGGSYFDASKGCPPFTHLHLTGGAIGSGPPLALGAALACPHRRVINLQADGSAMYSVQALWSQAREKCDITTIICANSQYAILKVECARQHLPMPGHATRSMTDLSQPTIDWVALAAGMGVRAVRVTTVGEIQEALQTSLATAGPMLIQAVL